MKLTHAVVQAAVTQILDDQPDPSYAVTERDLNVSEIEISRQTPPNPFDNIAVK